MEISDGMRERIAQAAIAKGATQAQIDAKMGAGTYQRLAGGAAPLPAPPSVSASASGVMTPNGYASTFGIAPTGTASATGAATTAQPNLSTSGGIAAAQAAMGQQLATSSAPLSNAARDALQARISQGARPTVNYEAFADTRNPFRRNYATSVPVIPGNELNPPTPTVSNGGNGGSVVGGQQLPRDLINNPPSIVSGSVPVSSPATDATALLLRRKKTLAGVPA
jgi:hypothetical protein